jgi:hypothetical protein
VHGTSSGDSEMQDMCARLGGLVRQVGARIVLELVEFPLIQTEKEICMTYICHV